MFWIEKSKIGTEKVELIEKNHVDVAKTVGDWLVKVPVYSSLGRTNEVFNFLVKSEDPNKWIQLGVSLFI